MRFLCPSDTLSEAASRGFTVDGLPIFVVRRAGQVYAYVNRCPHRRVALEWEADQFLDASASLIQCATHGALFLIESGECVSGPCAGDALKVVECREDAQGIWVQL